MAAHEFYVFFNGSSVVAVDDVVVVVDVVDDNDVVVSSNFRPLESTFDWSKISSQWQQQNKPRLSQ
jgi:hypothetical protein